MISPSPTQYNSFHWAGTTISSKEDDPPPRRYALPTPVKLNLACVSRIKCRETQGVCLVIKSNKKHSPLMTVPQVESRNASLSFPKLCTLIQVKCGNQFALLTRMLPWNTNDPLRRFSSPHTRKYTHLPSSYLHSPHPSRHFPLWLTLPCLGAACGPYRGRWLKEGALSSAQISAATNQGYVYQGMGLEGRRAAQTLESYMRNKVTVKLLNLQ